MIERGGSPQGKDSGASRRTLFSAGVVRQGVLVSGRGGDEMVLEQLTRNLVVAKRFFNGLPGLVKNENRKRRSPNARHSGDGDDVDDGTAQIVKMTTAREPGKHATLRVF